MAYEFHADVLRYFAMQRENSTDYLLPFVKRLFPDFVGLKVLEVGCAEGGVLKAFLDAGAEGAGIELSPGRYTQARSFLETELADGRVVLENENIYNVNVGETNGPFDLIVLKDVVEHIPDQARLLLHLKTFIKPGGAIFLGFPPWQMPFGGHQQICKNRLLSHLPYFHLLPAFVYEWLLETSKEPQGVAQELLELQQTGLSLEHFERLAHKAGFVVAERELYLINPIYKYKFGLTPRVQFPVISALPWLRNFFTTCAYYLIRADSKQIGT